MLRQEFFSLVGSHTTDTKLVSKLWTKVESAYGSPDRHYHNLAHLEQMLTALQPVKQLAEDWDTLLFALIYHDVVYKVLPSLTGKDNEYRSAEKAVKVLGTIYYPVDKTERCRRHILATKKHEASTDGDTNLLTDADLSILGLPWDKYEAYLKNIRKEYAIYPDIIYNPGRTKVLQSFLQMPRLYKTDYFYRQFEQTARENVRQELGIIS